MTVGPGEVNAAAQGAVAALSTVLAPSEVVGSRSEWAGAVGSLQQVIDVATAAQDAAIVRLAAIEPEWCEDGTEVETHHWLGHVALDAPAIVSGVLSVSVRHAEQRVEAAVLLAADGPEGSGTDSGLGGLHAAMGEGRLDSYRAGVVAEELAAAPPQVRETVVTMLEGHFEVEDGAHLRRRCRRALARISPELLLERAKQARAECGLRRWVAEPGVDRWEGTFPSEDAARAWAAIDALAHRYVKDDVCTHIEAARGKALTDLVAGQATIDTVLTITVPATGLTADTGLGTTAAVGTETSGQGSGSGDLVEVTGPAGNQPVFVSRAWVTAMATPNSRPGSRSKAKAKAKASTSTSTSTAPPVSGSTPSSGSGSQVVEVAPCHPHTGALVDPANQPAATDHPDGPTQRDGLTHIHGPTLPDEPTHPAGQTQPWAGAAPGIAQPFDAGPEAPSAATARIGIDTDTFVDAGTDGLDGDRVDSGRVEGTPDVVETIPVASDPNLAAVAVEVDQEAPAATTPAGGTAPDGASTLQQIAAGFGAGAYRPSARMAKRVKARDRRCRFPGCTLAAVFCDLDHVRPWPGGPTADTNLICLCRRHHRVKQRPGWHVTLAADGTVTWTDPTGRVRTTAPTDALTCTVLSGAATPAPVPASTSVTLTALPDGPFSDLEFLLEHLAAVASPPIRSHSHRMHPRPTSWRDDSGTRHSVDLTPTTHVMLLDNTATPCRRPRRGRHTFPDEPPF